MLKQSLLLGLLSGTIAGIASVVFQKIYGDSLGYTFSEVAKPVNMIIVSVVGTLLAAIGYWLIKNNLKKNGDLIFNLLFFILSFASILPVFAFKLPLEIEAPELFPGMVLPMHFFPALAWFTFKPLIFKD